MNEESRPERRLAAILAADVVGYSRLMGVDEEGTLAALKEHRSELIDPLIAQHQGRVVKTMGDGVLIEFASVIDAVRCAIVVQQGMEDRNANVDEAKQINFRVGINVGDIIVEDGDIFGDGVNIAARMEALAQPGQICVSGTVREHVGEKLPIRFIDMGEHQVKNIARPVHVFCIDTGLAKGGGDAKEQNDAGVLAVPDRPSIAVLPFTNMSGDADQGFFADGMVEDIITGLSRIKWLFVIARNSSFVYKGKSVDVKQAGRELGVRYILEGSVRRAAKRIRVTGQLIDAETGRHVWAEKYDRTLDDIFEIQDELTMSVVAAIEPNLRQAEIERVKRKRPDSLDAYELVLKAIPHVYTLMPEGARTAQPLLERALELDADYALARAFAAWCYEIQYMRGGLAEEHRRSAIRDAQAAISLGRDDATALTLGGFVVGMVLRDHRAARQAFDSALAISPTCALTYMLGCVIMGWTGETERALEWGEWAMRLSPIDPLSFLPQNMIAVARFTLGDYDDALDAARRASQANPSWSSAHLLQAAALAKLGRIDEAKAAGARVMDVQPGFTIEGHRTALGIAPPIAERLAEALGAAGLPA